MPVGHISKTKGFMRLPEVLELIPVGKSTWWSGIQHGRFPKGIKLSPRTTVWAVEDIEELIESIKQKSTQN